MSRGSWRGGSDFSRGTDLILLISEYGRKRATDGYEQSDAIFPAGN